MAQPVARGRHQPVATTPPGGEASRQPIAQLGDANMQKGGLTFGRVQHGEAVGALDAQYVTIKTTSTKNEYEIPHTLGHPAGFCMLVNGENRQSIASTYVAAARNRDSWSNTSCRVYITNPTGSMDGGELTFLVGGHR